MESSSNPVAGGPILDSDIQAEPETKEVRLFDNLNASCDFRGALEGGIWTVAVTIDQSFSTTGHGLSPFEAMCDAHQRINQVRFLQQKASETSQ